MTDFGEEFEKSPGPWHDTAFRLIFRKKKLAEDLIRNYLPEKIVERIDFSSLETVNGSFVDENFRQQHSDMIYKARLRGRSIFFFLLFEHQSRPDRRMPFRMLCYMVNLWRDFEAGHPQARYLPVIFPIVFYHGRRRWNAPLNFRDLLDGYDAANESFVPTFAYHLIDLAAYDDDDLVSGGDLALAVVLHLFKHVFDETFRDVFRDMADLVMEIDDRRMFTEILEWAVTYFMHARKEDAGELIEIITGEADRIGDERIRRVVMTAAEQLKKQGIETGIKKGLGMGRSELILKLLKKRFGSLSPSIEKKLGESGIDTLDRFGEAIFDFKELKDAEKWWEDYEKQGSG